MSWGNVTVLPASAVKPSEVKGQRSRALSAIKTKSAKPQIVQPKPTPNPLTASRIGLGNSIIASNMPGNPYLGAGPPGCAAKSMPAENARPVPVITNTLTRSSAAAAKTSAATASNISSLNALRASGRLKARVLTPPLLLTDVSISYPCVCFISVVPKV